MDANPLLGVFFHWLGGLASASFYVPFRGVKRWAWETYWLVGGVFSWIIVPWLLAGVMTRDLLAVLHQAPLSSILWTFIFGVLWGFGGLTFGLTMRYLGMSLGMAVALGYTAAFGTLMPPIFRGQFASEVLGSRSGIIILTGVVVCLAGIAFAGAAGISKERELSDEEKRATIEEFDLKRGLLVATFCGIMSACFAYGLAAGDPIKGITVAHGTSPLWQGLPVLVVLLAGGFTTNFVWCLVLHLRNHTGYQYLAAETRGPYPSRDEEPVIETATDAPGVELATQVMDAVQEQGKVPLIANYLFSALAGTTWYMQFFFYTMGETQMGRFKFSSWTLHMASIIIFSTLWGIALREWKGVSLRTRTLVACTLIVLIGSTVIVGYGNYLSIRPNSASASAQGVSH
ncbi:L-rhamnose/proton symporter RhaT [Pseudacidobacterium ailaaui]|uniref:L-rhamnose/proton symporter RhaT n=1 Tax=Pseudacidobacterium ailaaui TaxID=1382359 RepID=UPI00047AA620|nr:L-rhamnose/proton symporter RhaT [Pseudacidobacterium ailaaui]MBX6359223.1 L-rhamnose/proton symporter RhaT [Pseudacidobacterium ailaaui]MDI3255878.1 L-rhamnose/proton symporter RhaT [Bacillota bacterium]